MNNSGQTPEFWTEISRKLVGTPRFELGTPCTPCEQSLLDKSLTRQAESTEILFRIRSPYGLVSACLAENRGCDSERFWGVQ